MQNPDVDAAPGRRRPPAATLLDGLTPEQARAVSHSGGLLLLIAGPGAGKTRTLIHRIAWLLTRGFAEPWEILAVTFSVRAAGELRLRLGDLLGQHVTAAVTAATFHSVCARMLREDAALFGRNEQYTIYERSAHPAAPLVAAVWSEAEEELRRSSAFSFDDLLVCGMRILAEHPHRLVHYRERWKWVVVDEFQDTNEAHAVLIALLAGPDGNVCAVADDDQLIYFVAGRGAAQRARVRPALPRPRPDRPRPELPLTVGDLERRGGVRGPQRTAPRKGAGRGAWRAGGLVRVRGFQSEYHEAHWTARTVSQALAAGISPGEILVLARASYAAESVQTADGHLAPRVREPWVVRGLRGPRRAGLPHPAGQPGRRAGVSAGRAGAATRRRNRNHHASGRARPGATPR